LRISEASAPLLALAALSCERFILRTSESSADVRTGVAVAMDSAAAAISRRDPAGALGGAPTDSTVVYVSDGYVMRGAEAPAELSRFYRGLTDLEFRWMRREIQPVTQEAAVATAWAAIAWKDSAGVLGRDSAVFTLVYRRTAGSWRMITAQKTTLPR